MTPLDWSAPVANAAKMPPGWTDAAGVVLIGMSDRIGASLPAVLLATRRRLGHNEELEMEWTAGSTAALALLDPVFCLHALYSYWCARIDQGRTPAELEVPAKAALAAVLADHDLALVYARTMAIAELPGGTVPTFSRVLEAIRTQWRAIFGRDVRVDGPHPPPTLPWLTIGVACAAAWYAWRR